jgi:YaiO family outer membrane protein
MASRSQIITQFCFIGLSTGLGASPCFAQPVEQAPPVPATVFWAGLGRESISNGQAAWQQQDIGLRVGFAPRALWEVGARLVQRFGLKDTELSGGLAMPLQAGWSASANATYVPSSNFLAHASGTAQITRSLPGGWDLHANVQRRIYNTLNTNAFGAGIDKYIGDWRYAAAITYARSNLGPVGTTTKFQIDRELGDRAKISAIASFGDELDPARPGAQAYKVSSFVVFGIIPVLPNWAVRGELGTHRLGDLYRRTGGRLGVEYQF